MYPTLSALWAIECLARPTWYAIFLQGEWGMNLTGLGRF